MRSVLIDYARRRKARPEHYAESIDNGEFARFGSTNRNLEQGAILEVVLGSLQEVDKRAAYVVRLRYFLGLTVEETALFLGVSTRMVQRDWEFARGWLRDNWQSA
jgi:RNA polymerase sigma factor (sigma-70 family)